jgi:glutathione peroxidase
VSTIRRTGQQEPDAADKIKAFAKKKGVEFQIMGKVNVNGPDASLVYKYLKQQTGVASITWNFATYFVVSPEGVITAHSGVEPMELKGSVLSLLSKEEL